MSFSMIEGGLYGYMSTIQTLRYEIRLISLYLGVVLKLRTN